MSSLTCKENRPGKLRWIYIEPMGVMIILGLLAAITGAQLRSVTVILPFALSISGLVLLIISKVSLFRKGIWFSLGSKSMIKGYARLYKASYILIGIGAFFLSLLANRLTL